MSEAYPPLFERVPAEIFRPLGVANARKHWALLCRLMTELWGDGGHSPGEEITKSSVIKVIESYLVADDPWEEELETPLAIRAHGLYQVFHESGWLTQRRRGVLDMATVRPVVAQFFTLLCDFANQEPELLGSKVRLIHLSLQAVERGEAGGEMYAEAAKQAKRCMAHISSTGCRVHDLMDELVSMKSAAAFVKGFFEEYVEKVFIADYSEIRTKDHPLQYRTAIVGTTIRFQHDSARRAALIEWYRSKRTAGDVLKAEALYDRDTRHLLRLQDVEDHLRRLDDEIRIANQRAMAFIEYKLRAPRNFDKLIARAIAATDDLAEGDIALPNATGVGHASEHGLAKPRQASKEPTSTRLEKRQPTIEEMALEELRRRMTSNRMIKPVHLAQYVARHLEGTSVAHSDQLQIKTITDLCCYQRLLLIASREKCPPTMRQNDPHLRMIPRLRVSFVPGARSKNRFMDHTAFTIQVETR